MLRDVRTMFFLAEAENVNSGKFPLKSIVIWQLTFAIIIQKWKLTVKSSKKLFISQCKAQNVRNDKIYHMQCNNDGSVYTFPDLHLHGHLKVKLFYFILWSLVPQISWYILLDRHWMRKNQRLWFLTWGIFVWEGRL